MTPTTGSLEADRVLHDGADGLQFFDRVLPLYNQWTGGHEVTAATLRDAYFQQQGMDLDAIERFGATLKTQLDATEDAAATQSRVVEAVAYHWHDSAGATASSMLKRVHTRASDDIAAMRKVVDAIENTVGELRDCVRHKAKVTGELPNSIGGKDVSVIERIVSYAQGHFGAAVDQAAQSDLVKSVLGHAPDAESARDVCAKWLDDVFAPAVKGHVADFLTLCQTADHKVADALEALIKQINAIGHDPYPTPQISPAGNGTPGRVVAQEVAAVTKTQSPGDGNAPTPPAPDSPTTTPASAQQPSAAPVAGDQSANAAAAAPQGDPSPQGPQSPQGPPSHTDSGAPGQSAPASASPSEAHPATPQTPSPAPGKPAAPPSPYQNVLDAAQAVTQVDQAVSATTQAVTGVVEAPFKVFSDVVGDLTGGVGAMVDTADKSAKEIAEIAEQPLDFVHHNVGDLTDSADKTIATGNNLLGAVDHGHQTSEQIAGHDPTGHTPDHHDSGGAPPASPTGDPHGAAGSPTGHPAADPAAGGTGQAGTQAHPEPPAHDTSSTPQSSTTAAADHNDAPAATPVAATGAYAKPHERHPSQPGTTSQPGVTVVEPVAESGDSSGGPAAQLAGGVAAADRTKDNR